jgi:hypothetical protein
MQPAYLAPAAVPSVLEMLVPMPAPPGGSGNARKLLLATPPALFEGADFRFATDGDFEPPPHPETARASVVRTPAKNHQRTLAPATVPR